MPTVIARIIALLRNIFQSIIPGRGNSPLSPAELDDAKRRVQALQERAKTQFIASPGDPRLKPDWEYLVVLKPSGEQSLTFTFFDKEGVTRSEKGKSQQDMDVLTRNGWFINGQTFTIEGTSWQLERLIPPVAS